MKRKIHECCLNIFFHTTTTSNSLKISKYMKASVLNNSIPIFVKAVKNELRFIEIKRLFSFQLTVIITNIDCHYGMFSLSNKLFPLFYCEASSAYKNVVFR